jgi:hypothetical protein
MAPAPAGPSDPGRSVANTCSPPPQIPGWRSAHGATPSGVLSTWRSPSPRSPTSCRAATPTTSRSTRTASRYARPRAPGGRARRLREPNAARRPWRTARGAGRSTPHPCGEVLERPCWEAVGAHIRRAAASGPPLGGPRRVRGRARGRRRRRPPSSPERRQATSKHGTRRRRPPSSASVAKRRPSTTPGAGAPTVGAQEQPFNDDEPPPKGRLIKVNRRRPTLPGPCGPSTIGAERLNFSVRNGKRCFPLAIATGNSREPTAAPQNRTARHRAPPTRDK